MEVIIWSTKRIDLSKVSSTFLENTHNRFLNEFTTYFKIGERFESSFLFSFNKTIVEAKSRPQYHIIILDTLIVKENNYLTLIDIFKCMIDLIETHPMKCLTFYDVKDGKSIDTFHELIFSLHTQIDPRSLTLRFCRNDGPMLMTKADGTLSTVSLAVLARTLVNVIRQHLNLK